MNNYMEANQVFDLKVRELKILGYKSISKQDLIDYLEEVIWDGKERQLYQIVNDILLINPNDLFDYLNSNVEIENIQSCIKDLL